MMATLTDEELVMRCKAELPTNTRSYEILVQRYMNRVYSIVYRVVYNREEAEDITQEVFVKVYNGIKKFEQQASFSSWLYRIATNSALDALDRMKRQRSNVLSFSNRGQKQEREEEVDPLAQQVSPESGPEEKSIQRELRECIHRVLKKLDREQARILVLRDFEDMSYDEITVLLTSSLSAVKMRIHRARLAFQDMFGQFCGSVYSAISVVPGNNAKGKARGKKG
ncbi:MAG TPA: sigma-70 family RNA polymerase sigma factor [Ktedonobacteraceae bacterium]|nr:sigma-70 family RNA polymerase sigma factor [Ktedonobacteraceae bacterium]